MKVCVVGAGEAGLCTAKRVSENGAEVFVVERASGGLPRRSWSRLIENPDLLTKQSSEQRSAMRLGEMVLGEAIAAVRGEVTTTVGRFRADSVVIASGSRPVPKRFLGVEKGRIVSLGGPQEYARLGEFSPLASSPCVWGPLLGSMKVAERVAGGGRTVRVFAIDRIEGSGAAVRSVLLDSAADAGIAVGHGGIERACGAKGVEAVISDQEVFPCDLLAVLPEMVPSTPTSQALTGPWGGIVVDRRMMSTIPEVYSAGSCAEMRAPQGFGNFTLDSSPGTSGRAAGDNASGGSTAFVPIRSRSERVLGLRVVAVGYTAAEARCAGFTAAEASLRLDRRTACSIVFERMRGQVLGMQLAGPSDSVSPYGAYLAVADGATIKSLACGGIEGSTDISLVEETARQGIRNWCAS